jgi:hypothetical protein
MKLDHKVVVMPQPGNQGEDLNWISWMVFSHEDETQLAQEIVKPLVAEFLHLPFMDPGHDEWEDLDPAEYTQRFLDFMDVKGYIVFPLTKLQWCV